jgi:4-hydroxybenzoate polyprenyltransferase
LEVCREGQFDYAGNDAVDLPILSRARYAILVNPTQRVKKATQRTARLQHIFAEPRTGLVPYLKAIRVHQWLKNLLLFVPLFTAHEWSNLTLALHAFLGWFAFSQCASSVYLLNDLLDLPADRNHPRKRTRPLAAGDIPLLHGGGLMILLLFLGLSTAVGLSWRFLGLVLLYLVCNLAYSLRLKAMALIDVLILAGLYTLRIIAGAVAIEVMPSFWLLAFSMFVFLSLALVKRCSELHTCLKMSQQETRGRGYQVSDLDYLHSMGTASGYLAVLVLALYVNNPELAKHYSHPEILWVLCLTVLYWVSRVWLKAGRGEMHDDPLVFTIKDRGSQLVFIASVIAMFLAR